MTEAAERECFAWALGALVDGADLLPVFKSVALMREAARLINLATINILGGCYAKQSERDAETARDS